MEVDEYRRHDGLGLASLIRSGDVSRGEVFEAACAGIEADNPSLAAVVRTRFERARVEGRQVDPAAPFAGVPTLTKDLLMALEGEPLAFGSASLADWKAPAGRQRPWPLGWCRWPWPASWLCVSRVRNR